MCCSFPGPSAEAAPPAHVASPSSRARLRKRDLTLEATAFERDGSCFFAGAVRLIFERASIGHLDWAIFLAG